MVYSRTLLSLIAILGALGGGIVKVYIAGLVRLCILQLVETSIWFMNLL